MVGVLIVLLRNGWQSGGARHAWRLAALGVSLNLLVVIANGGYMPRAEEAGTQADAALMGASTPPGPQRLINITPLTPESRLAWLGDVLPQPAWFPMRNVMSIGDLLLSAGVAWCAFLATGAQARPVRRQRRGDAETRREGKIGAREGIGTA
jgi:hypothetical protein